MSFTSFEFAEARPYLYHLTDNENIASIRENKNLKSARTLMEMAEDCSILRFKRPQRKTLRVADRNVHLRDQKPLHRGNTDLQDGWEFGDLIQQLNSMVFFWPGKPHGPISYGIRHFERYKDEDVRILRVRTAALFDINMNQPPLYCKYNSGSPRCSKGKASPRGPATFVDSMDADFTASKVVEVTFAGSVEIPADAEIGKSPAGPWQPLL